MRARPSPPDLVGCFQQCRGRKVERGLLATAAVASHDRGEVQPRRGAHERTMEHAAGQPVPDECDPLAWHRPAGGHALSAIHTPPTTTKTMAMTRRVIRILATIAMIAAAMISARITPRRLRPIPRARRAERGRRALT